MFKLDNDFLQSLGLGGLPVEEKNRLLQMIYERLEMNVGMRLAEKMTDQQLDEFEGFIDRNDEAGALKWLETNFPNYKDVVAEELEKLKAEVQQAAPQILAAAPQAGGVPGQMPPIGQAPIMPGVSPGPQPQPMYPPAGSQPQYGQPQQPQPPMYPPAGQPPAPQPHYQPAQPPQQPAPQFDAPAPQAPPAPQFDAPTPQAPPAPQQQPPSSTPPPAATQPPSDPTQAQQFTPPPADFNPGV